MQAKTNKRMNNAKNLFNLIHKQTHRDSNQFRWIKIADQLRYVRLLHAEVISENTRYSIITIRNRDASR